MSSAEARTNVGITQIVALLLALATGTIHFYLFIVDGFLGRGSMLPTFQVLFVGNFLAYAGLAVLLTLPIAPLAQVRSLIRVALIAIAVASFFSYINVGVFTTLGNFAKAIEVLLVIAVALDAASSSADGDVAGNLAGGVVGAIVQLVVGVAAGLAMFWFMISFLI